MAANSGAGKSPNSPQLPPEILSGLLDNRYEGITVVDHEGTIIFISPSTERYFGLKSNEGAGKHVTEIFPDSNLHRVAKTGKAEIGVTVEVRGQKKIVSRIPILHNKKIVGAVSKIMFRDIDSLIKAAVRKPTLLNNMDYSYASSQEIECEHFTPDYIIGKSPQALAIKEFVQMASKTSSNVLITGETGCGKEVVAQSIHDLSPRSSQQFIGINCSAIPQNLFESELFGYAPGAFTGAAKKGKDGLFRLAHNGTLFLDEITELPLEMQPKLLRVLQEKAFYLLGGEKKIGVNFRLICACNKDIEKMVDQGDFRQDLFFRLNVLNIGIPPLRDRIEDIPELSYYLLARLRRDMETEVKHIAPEVFDVFKKYYWKGNVRELDNILERAINVATGDTLHVEHLPQSLLEAVVDKLVAADGKAKLKRRKERIERSCIVDALERAQGNKTAAAKILGIHRTHLYKKMKKYGVK